MKKGWLYGLVFSSLWIALKMLAFLFNWRLDEIQIFVLLNMAFLTGAIALFMYRKKRTNTEESNILTDIKAGLTVGLPYTLLVSFFLFFYYKDIYPEFNEHKRAAYERKMDSPEEIAAIRKGNSALENKSDAEIVAMARQNTAMMYDPQFTLSVSLLALLVYGTLNSLLIAVIYRRVVFRD
jgi:amino acid transporter